MPMLETYNTILRIVLINTLFISSPLNINLTLKCVYFVVNNINIKRRFIIYIINIFLYKYK